MFELRCCSGYCPVFLVVRELKHAMKRIINRELTASRWPIVDRNLVGSWRWDSGEGVIRDGSVSEGVRKGARTHCGFGRRGRRHDHECSRCSSRSVAIKSQASLEVALGHRAIVAIRDCRISFAIVCKSRRGYQTHLSASGCIGTFQLVVRRIEIDIVAKINTIAIL